MAGTYDENLLAAAPAATRAELQEGYNVDILTPNRVPKTTPPPPPPRSSEPPVSEPRVSTPLVESGSARVSREKLPVSMRPRLPWWRTGKGAAIIVVGVLILIGVVVGGAVGGTRTHHNEMAQTQTQAQATTTATTSQGPQSNPTATNSGPGFAPNSSGASQSAAPTPTTSRGLNMIVARATAA